MQVQRNSFQWFHEEDLPLDSITVVPPVRLQFLADLKGSVGNLGAMLESVTEMQRRYQGPSTCDFCTNIGPYNPLPLTAFGTIVQRYSLPCRVRFGVVSFWDLFHVPASWPSFLPRKALLATSVLFSQDIACGWIRLYNIY